MSTFRTIGLRCVAAIGAMAAISASGAAAADGDQTPGPAAPSLSAPAPGSAVTPSAPVTAAPLPGASAPSAPPAPGETTGKSSFTIDNVDITQPTGSLKAPRIEVEGSSVPQAELRHLLDFTSSDPVVDRLRQVSIDRVRIPELTTVQGSGPTAKTTIYRDLVLEGVGSGKVAHIEASGGTYSEAGPARPSTFGRMEASDPDIALFVALVSETGDGAGGKLFTAFSLDDLQTSDGETGKVSLAHVALGPVSARTPEGGFASTFSAATADAPEDDKSAQHRQAEAVLKLVNSLDVGPVQITGLKTTSSDGGKAEIQSLGYGPDGDGHDSFHLAGLSGGDKDGVLKIGEISIEGVDVKKSVALIVEIAFGGALDDPRSIASLSRGLPTSPKLRVRQASFSGEPSADANLADKATAPLREPDVSIGSIDITAVAGTAGANSAKFTVTDIAVPFRRDGPLSQGADLGYDRFFGSFGITDSFVPATKTLSFDDLSVVAPGMGSFTFSGAIDNIDPTAARSGDSDAAAAAFMKARFRHLDISLRDDGLAGHLLAYQAKREHKSESALRTEYGSQAALGIGMMLGGSPAASTLGTAVAGFISKPGHLEIHVRPKTGDGVPIADLIGGSDPSEFLSHLDVEAKAD